MSDADTVDLYRFYDAEGRLLYIGRSVQVLGRLESHKYTKDWWPTVARMDIEKVSAKQASDAELSAIARECPLYNVAGSGGKINDTGVRISVTHAKSDEYSRRYRDRKRGGPPRTPAPCGTRAAAARHRRRGEPLDVACVDAERAYQREVARRRRKGTT